MYSEEATMLRKKSHSPKIACAQGVPTARVGYGNLCYPQDVPVEHAPPLANGICIAWFENKNPFYVFRLRDVIGRLWDPQDAVEFCKKHLSGNDMYNKKTTVLRRSILWVEQNTTNTLFRSVGTSCAAIRK
ncbi:MAG: hypothetical protein ABIU63_01360 [Chitinophagaceae bacterium]